MTMCDFENIRAAIVASGSITPNDIDTLRSIVYSEGKVDQNGAEFLFKLKKELGDFGNLNAWNDFFIQAICDFILDDDRSPDAIDDLEAIWLIEQIGEDSIIDNVEQRLLKRLRKEARRFPSSLQEVQKHTSIAKDLGQRIFLLLCRNSKTMRTMEYGVNRTGERKASVYHIRTNTNSDDDDYEA